MSRVLTPQQLLEDLLAAAAAAGAGDCVVIVRARSSANLRWANNTLTTNGVATGLEATVIAICGSGSAARCGVLGRTGVTADQVAELAAGAVDAAREAAPAEDARQLVPGEVADDFGAEPGDTSIAVFADFAPGLGEVLAAADSGSKWLYGYAEHELTTSYLGSSTGLRVRHEQPSGFVSVTGKDADLTNSAWVGQATRDFRDVDPGAIDAELSRRLGWAKRRIDLDAGRYPTVLPADAVADLTTYLYWSMSGRDAFEGRSAFADGPGRTKVGSNLSPHPVRFGSDPAHPGLECEPFVLAAGSSAVSSVFDNGLQLTATDWISDGRLEHLIQTRFSAGLTDSAVTPQLSNYVLDVGGATGGVDDLVASVSSGLLATCLWYIREVDPQTLLLTGLTRDGVYRIEHGEVTGAVNNFRFNESPVELLGRFERAGATEPSFSREWGDYFPRSSTPAMLVPDFNMSSVSQAR